MITSTNNAALVLFSGGQDSTVCLAWALDRYERIETVGFTYGQRHAAELGQRPGRRIVLTGHQVVAAGEDQVLVPALAQHQRGPVWRGSRADLFPRQHDE